MREPSGGGRPLTDYLYRKACAMGVPLNGTFELSPVCNFACRMCYVRQTPQAVQASSRGILTLADWCRIAQEARAAGMLELLLTGGEPLLWPDFWPLYETLAEMGFLISINTNGALLDGAAVARFCRKPPRRINVTLYGASDATYRRLCGVSGAFAGVDAGIRGLVDAGIPLKLNCSLTPENACDLDAMVDYAAARGTVLSLATYMFPPVRRDPAQIGENERFTPEASAQHLLRYLRRSRGETAYAHYLHRVLDGYAEPPGLDPACEDPVDGLIRCRAGRAAFWITWDGWMMPCGMMTHPRIDAREQPFSAAWQTLTEQTAAIRLSGLCADCANRNICHPCAASALAETGQFSGVPVYRCRETREMCRIARAACESEAPGSGAVPQRTVSNNDEGHARSRAD